MTDQQENTIPPLELTNDAFQNETTVPPSSSNNVESTSSEDIAFLAAYKNLLNCIALKGAFSSGSIETFKKKNREHAETIESLVGPISDPTEWIRLLSNFAVNSRNEELKKAAMETFGKAVEKNLTIPEDIREKWFPTSTLSRITDSLKRLLTPRKERMLVVEDKKESYVPPVVIPTKLTFEEKESDSDSIDTIVQANKSKRKSRSQSIGSSVYYSEDEEDKKNNNDAFLKTIDKLASSITYSRPLRINTLRNNTQSVKTWFELFERQTADRSDADKAKELPLWLEDKALRLWELADTTKKNDYQALKKSIIDGLNPPEKTCSLKGKFYNAKQKAGESADEFAQRLLLILKDYPEKDKKDAEKEISGVFINGLNPALQKLLIGKEEIKFEKLWTRAKQLEKCIDKETQIEEPVNPIAKYNNSQSNSVCYSCGRKGHFAKQCYSRKPQISRQPQQSNRVNHYSNKNPSYRTTQPDNKSSKFCNICSKTNHSSSECRYANKNKKPTNTTTPSPVNKQQNKSN